MTAEHSFAATLPWYDSIWLRKYLKAKQLIARDYPDRLADFVATFECLKTSPSFSTRFLDRVFDDETMAQIKQTIKGIPPQRLELHETRTFKRLIVHNEPYFTELQKTTVDLVSEVAGEAVEPSYTFLSLYSSLGVCPVHMDSPQSKWTLDVCVAQSAPWPIHFSQVVPWPDGSKVYGDDWENEIRHDPSLNYQSVSLEAGNAAVFSGSSQWHYRDNIKTTGANNHCTLLFFHYVPKGMLGKVEPKNWPAYVGIPEVADAVV